jgi:hypothetical protein
MRVVTRPFALKLRFRRRATPNPTRNSPATAMITYLAVIVKYSHICRSMRTSL